MIFNRLKKEINSLKKEVDRLSKKNVTLEKHISNIINSEPLLYTIVLEGGKEIKVKADGYNYDYWSEKAYNFMLEGRIIAKVIGVKAFYVFGKDEG